MEKINKKLKDEEEKKQLNFHKVQTVENEEEKADENENE